MSADRALLCGSAKGRGPRRFCPRDGCALSSGLSTGKTAGSDPGKV